MMIFDTLKIAANILKEAGKIEQYKQILEVQAQMLEMQKENAKLREKNTKLREKLAINDSLIFSKNTYWAQKGEKLEGPFCTRCWDAENKLIHMQPTGNPAFYKCQNCKSDSLKIYPERDVVTASFHRPRNNFV